MSRIRFMSPYLKGGRDAAKLSNRARYIATRPGVEVLRGEHSNQPATKKQQAYIQRLLRDFPGAEELLEYEGYRNTPTQANADTFIRQVQEDFAEPMSRMENYLDYVSHRPGVQMDGEHGLWYTEGKVRNLSQAVREVAEHTGSVWMPVVAIRREDAERLGYNDAESWRQLVCACAPEIARGYKIPLEHLHWYAAFHRKEDSVHIHMVVFSSDPKEGYLTRQGTQTHWAVSHADTAQCVLMLFHNMGRIFQEQSAADTIQAGLHIDKKRRRMLREKRMALGHKADDHEEIPQHSQR